MQLSFVSTRREVNAWYIAMRPICGTGSNGIFDWTEHKVMGSSRGQTLLTNVLVWIIFVGMLSQFGIMWDLNRISGSFTS